MTEFHWLPALIIAVGMASALQENCHRMLAAETSFITSLEKDILNRGACFNVPAWIPDTLQSLRSLRGRG